MFASFESSSLDVLFQEMTTMWNPHSWYSTAKDEWYKAKNACSGTVYSAVARTYASTSSCRGKITEAFEALEKFDLSRKVSFNYLTFQTGI